MSLIKRSLYLALAFTVASPLVLVANAPAAADPVQCADYVFVGARGSGEDAPTPDYTGGDFGMGPIVYDVYQRVSAAATAAGKTIQPYGVRYPAMAMDQVLDIAFESVDVNANYTASVQAGQQDFVNEMNSVNADCPSTKFIVAGYSQGSQVVSDSITAGNGTPIWLRLSSSIRQHIVAATYFGDTRFNADDVATARSYFDPQYFGFLGPRETFATSDPETSVTDYCHDGDPICGLKARTTILGQTYYYDDIVHALNISNAFGHGADVVQQHLHYDTEGDTQKAAQDIMGALNLQSSTNKAPEDIVFAIDSTGSMGGEIDTIEANVSDLVNTIAGTSSGYRFALVDYKDSADQGDPYQARIDVPFTTDAAAFSQGLHALTASGGGDYPESVYSGIMTALNMPWRNGVRKSVIVIGDAPGKDPEPATGYTLSQVVDKAYSVDPAQIYTVPVYNWSDTVGFFSPIATQTGGQLVVASGSGGLISALENVIVQAGTSPQAAVTASTAAAGATAVASAAGTSAAAGDPVISYKWNWGDGTPSGSWDETTTEPRAEHVYAAPGTYTVSVQAIAGSGLTGLATTQEVVAPAATAPPAAVTGVSAALSGSEATLTWQASPNAKFYTVKDTDGSLIAAFTPSDYSAATVSWSQTLDPVATKTWSVSAVNDAGVSSPVNVTLTVTSGASLTTLAGSSSGYAESPSAPLLNAPSGITAYGGNLFFLDSSAPRLRQLTTAGVSSFIAGRSSSAFLDGTGSGAAFNWPQAVTSDSSGNLYVADTNNNRIRKVTPAGVVTTLTGGSSGHANGACSSATFSAPRGIAFSNGTLYVADSNNHLIRAIALATCTVSTFAGALGGGFADATGTSAKFLLPEGVAVDGSGNLFVADTNNNRIRKITSSGSVSTVAGIASAGAVDGPTSAASFNNPRSVAVGGDGSLYVADSNNHEIREIANGSVETLVGNGTAGSQDGNGTAAQLNTPTALVLLGTTLYIADTGNNRIRALALG